MTRILLNKKTWNVLYNFIESILNEDDEDEIIREKRIRREYRETMRLLKKYKVDDFVIEYCKKLYKNKDEVKQKLKKYKSVEEYLNDRNIYMNETQRTSNKITIKEGVIMDRKKLIKEIKERKEEIENLISDVINELTEQNKLPTDIEKGSLHKILGYDEETNLNEVSTDEFIKRQKKQINDKKVTYKELIQKLNWQKTMNKTKNKDFSKKLDNIMKELKKWWEKKKD